MNASQKIIVGVTIVFAAVLAYLVKDIIKAVFFEPFSFVWYAMNLLYLSVAQVVYWFGLIVIVALIAFGSLYGKFGSARIYVEEPAPEHGPVGKVARHIMRNGEGMYYKWLMANRLGKLARSMLQQRSGVDDSSDGELKGQGWQPSAEVRAYLETGLTQTFADFPRRNWFARQPETPLDIHIEQVITYLESQMEDLND